MGYCLSQEKAMFIELHVIQSLPPSNANRGQNGAPKSVTYGGTIRTRLSSQSQKRSARLWYQENSKINRGNLGTRSRRWAHTLADRLSIGQSEDDKEKIALLLLNLFNTSPEKLFHACMDGHTNLLFLVDHEIDCLASIASQYSDLLLELLERLNGYIAYSEADDGKKKKSYNAHPTKAELSKLTREITKQFRDSVPGDVALFGRMMATLTETSVDGCVQVADAISVNSAPLGRVTENGKIRTVVGEIDFFSAVDDISPIDEEAGAGMIGEVPFTAPVFYRYANLCHHELADLLGDSGQLSRDIAAAFIKGFICSLPSGYGNRFAHGTLPDAVLIKVTPYQPINHAPAFLEAIDTSIRGEDSISQQAVKLLIQRDTEISNIYDMAPSFYQWIGESSHVVSSIGLGDAINQALDVAEGV